MIQRQLKLRLNKKQEATLNEWLWILTGVHNWAIKKIGNDAKDGIYHSKLDFQNILAKHGNKIGISSHTIQSMLSQVHATWSRCFKKLGGKPKLKGQRNKLTSVAFPDPIRPAKGNHIGLPGIGILRFHKQDIPEGRIKCGRIVKKASGWYLCLFIDAERAPIERKGFGTIGIDPGFKDLLVLSNGEKIPHPKELERCKRRVAQAQRGTNRKLVARTHERIANQRRDRNHKLSLRLVQENKTIYFSDDNTKEIAKRFGKSVASSGHAQLRQMLSYKSHIGGTDYIEVDSRNSTRTCSSCEALTGPTGLAGLKVRSWVCMNCGSSHDRDINAAINIFKIGVGITLEMEMQQAA